MTNSFADKLGEGGYGSVFKGKLSDGRLVAVKVLNDANEFCPKISDFGLAKLCQRKKSIVSMLGARGTPGYIAPEVFCRNFGEVSHKSDVYSYGMMVINMVGAGKKAEVGSNLDSASEMYFVDIIYKHLELGENSSLLQGVKSEDIEETRRKMVMVLEMLEGSIESIEVAPKPFFPMRVNLDSFSALSGSCEIERH
ncbi:hypothetical protein LguiA_014128 [Lonicera macranthoides]